MLVSRLELLTARFPPLAQFAAPSSLGLLFILTVFGL